MYPILECLDKTYGVDKYNQLDANLLYFLDYSRIKDLTVEHFISGFHTGANRPSSLNLDDKLKGHHLLCQANLAHYDKHVVGSSTSRSYDFSRITAALRNTYKNSAPFDSTPRERNRNGQGHKKYLHRNRGKRHEGKGRSEKHRGNSQEPNKDHRPTFYAQSPRGNQ